MRLKRTERIYIFITLMISFLIDMAAYMGGKVKDNTVYHFLTTEFDKMIPFIPETIVIYIGSFLFWLIIYYLIVSGRTEDTLYIYDKDSKETGGEERDRFFCADILGKIVCFVIFIVFPTAIIRPETGTGNMFETAVTLAYQIDTPTNLMPSLHCFVSWMCWIGVRKRKDLPGVLRYSALVMALLIFLSTLTVKQHVIADVIAGAFLAEICYLLAGFERIRVLYSFPVKKLISGLCRSKEIA